MTTPVSVKPIDNLYVFSSHECKKMAEEALNSEVTATATLISTKTWNVAQPVATLHRLVNVRNVFVGIVYCGKRKNTELHLDGFGVR